MNLSKLDLTSMVRFRDGNLCQLGEKWWLDSLIS